MENSGNKSVKSERVGIQRINKKEDKLARELTPVGENPYNRINLLKS